MEWRNKNWPFSDIIAWRFGARKARRWIFSHGNYPKHTSKSRPCYHGCRWALIWTPSRIYGNNWKLESTVELPWTCRIETSHHWRMEQYQTETMSNLVINFWENCWRLWRWKVIILIVNVIIMSSFSNCTNNFESKFVAIFVCYYSWTQNFVMKIAYCFPRCVILLCEMLMPVQKIVFELLKKVMSCRGCTNNFVSNCS